MSIIIHPTYFPSIAYFVALVKNNIIFEVSDHYQKQTYRNRAYLYSPNGKQLLSVPVEHTKKKGRQYYKEVKIANSFNWRKQHQKTIATLYRSSPFFEFYEDDIFPIFEKRYCFLTDLNMETIQVILRCLRMDITAQKTVSYTGCFPNTLDLRNLADAKTGTSFYFEKYEQLFQERHGFIANLSILDLLFNQGTHTVSYLERQNLKDAITGK